jgi:cytochrome c oxidase subunit II
MNQGFQLFPEQASSVAPHVDALYFFLLGVAAFFTVAIFVAIVFLALFYRRSAVRNRTRSHSGKVWILEVTWIVIPFLLTMSMFLWGADLYFDIRTPPADAIELQVVGKQWMWKIQHPQGRSEINELHVPIDQPIRLRMISEDVIHSFYIPAFRVKMDVLPGRYSSLWFRPTRLGEYFLFCAEYCGTDHAKMSGRVHVMGQAEYAAWLAGSKDEPPEASGARLFTQYRCHTCHHEDPDARCPSLKGLFGSTVQLADGSRVPADTDYLRESIVDPMKKVTAGFQPVMPTYSKQLTEEQIMQLIEYIKSLSPNDTAKSS